jgi:hypothetical protein
VFEPGLCRGRRTLGSTKEIRQSAQLASCQFSRGRRNGSLTPLFHIIKDPFKRHAVLLDFPGQIGFEDAFTP